MMLGCVVNRHIVHFCPFANSTTVTIFVSDNWISLLMRCKFLLVVRIGEFFPKCPCLNPKLPLQNKFKVTNNTNKIYYKNRSNAWVQVGTSSWSGGTKLFQTSAHSSRPEWKTAESNAPTGSVWFKTTTPNSGADVAIKKYNSSTSAWSQGCRQ